MKKRNNHCKALAACAAAAALVCLGEARASSATGPSVLDASVLEKARQLALDGARSAAPKGTRIEAQFGRIDPRLRLAPCDRMEPYVPALARMWGKSRLGVRCKEGPVHWNIYLPVTIKVFGTSLVAAGPLNAGTILAANDLREAEVDLAEESAPAVSSRNLAVGRALNRALTPGQPLRQDDLKSRQWFAAGETVRIVAVGAGYSVTSEGQALNPGLEGRTVRVRTDSGRVITGQAVAERRVEIPL